MNHFVRQIIRISFLIAILVTIFETESHAQTKRGTLKNKGGDHSANATDKKARRGGRNTLPVGIDGKKINAGIGVGLAFPGLSMKSMEYASMGRNIHLYAHYVTKNVPTLAFGINANLISLGVNKTRFFAENQKLSNLTAAAWNFNTISPSILANYNLAPRIDAQFMFNTGILLAKIPKIRQTFSDTIVNTGAVTTQSYQYQEETKTGWFASAAFQFNYALTRNIEARLGFDYFYGRFSYQKINLNNPYLNSTKQKRELKLIDFFTGIAVSF